MTIKSGLRLERKQQKGAGGLFARLFSFPTPPPCGTMLVRNLTLIVPSRDAESRPTWILFSLHVT